MYHQPAINFGPEEVIDYLRKSQSDDPLLSVEEVLEKHEGLLDEWSIKYLGGKVPEENKYREIVSGETLKDRPEINKVLRKIESPKIKAIKIVEPQRLTRGDLEDIGRIMKLLKHTNTLVITMDRLYDLRSEYDWEAFERELKKGNDYLEYYKKIQARGRLISVSKGNFIGSKAPYGYDKTIVMDGKTKCPTLKINEEKAAVVRMIFDMYVNQDMGRVNIAHRLDELGIKPPKTKNWSQDTIKTMLENDHYIGKVRWNWRKTVTIVEEGEIRQTRPKTKVGEYLIYDGKQPPIVSEELFYAARAKQGRNHRAKPNTKIRNPLAGLLYCQCGRAMSLRTYKYHNAEPRLLCDGQVHCKTGSCLYKEMIDRVCSILEQCIEDFEIRIENNEENSIKYHATLIKNLEKKMEYLGEKELAQWEAQVNPDPEKRMPQEIFKKLNAKLLEEKEEVKEALCHAYKSMPEPVDYEARSATFKEALAALRNPDIDAQKKNRLLKACIERIDYKREKPERIKSQQVRQYNPELKKTVSKSPLKTGGNWTNPPIELDVKLKV